MIMKIMLIITIMILILIKMTIITNSKRTTTIIIAIIKLQQQQLTKIRIIAITNNAHSNAITSRTKRKKEKRCLRTSTFLNTGRNF